MPDISAAVAIVEGEPTARLAVEAGLLAGEPIEAVARRCGVPVEAAEVYEQLFFNVVDRLENTSYILFHAVGAASYKGFAGDDSGAVLKWFAYMGGPVVLDALIDLDFGSPDRPEDERFLDELRLKLAVAIKLLPIDSSTAPRLIRLYLRLRQAELAAEKARRAAVDLLPNIRAMLADLRWIQPNGQSWAATTGGVEGPARGASADVDARASAVP
jgi:hypothetical protein